MFSSVFFFSRGHVVKYIIALAVLVMLTLIHILIFENSVKVDDSISRQRNFNIPDLISSKGTRKTPNGLQFQLSQKSNISSAMFYQLVKSSEISKKSRIDKMVLLRRLILYSVHLLNKKIQTNALCVKWWANPLTLTKFSSALVNSKDKEWTLRFKLEPGNMPVEAVTRQTTIMGSSIPINFRLQQEFELISITKLDYGPSRKDIVLDGLCVPRDEAAELRSLQARAEWNKSDPELDHWPPNSSFIFTDYMEFFDQNYFLISPGKAQNLGTSYCYSAVKLIVLLHSAPSHFDRRAAIRQSYGSQQNLEHYRAQLVFFLGTVEDVRLQEAVNREVEEFDDIVQANFVDSYHNLTFKSLSCFQWIYLRCTNGSEANINNLPDYILKSDDDIILNLETIIRVADSNPGAGMIGTSMCAKPKRGVDNHKYYIPKYMYPPDEFHGFLVGGAYFLRAELIPKLLWAALTTAFWNLEDTLITGGDLARRINISSETSSLYSFSPSYDTEDPCYAAIRATSQMFQDSSEMLRHWNRMFLHPLHRNCGFNISTVNFKSSAIVCPS